MTKTLLCLVALLLAPGFAYSASPSANLSVNVVPANNPGNPGCGPQNHGATRGRPIITQTTILAEDGCLLTSTSFGIFNNPPGQFPPISYYQDIHDNRHYNAIRFLAYIGGWWGTTNNEQTISSMEGMVDWAVSQTAQTGLYLIIDNHSTNGSGSPCPDWNQDNTFWTAFAPRYANNTHVIYELQNEPDDCGSPIDTGQENAIYDLIRSYAPSTPIIMNSTASITNTLPNIMQQEPDVNWSNAVVGWHAYWNSLSDIESNLSTIMSAGYPSIMTEYTPCLNYTDSSDGYSFLTFSDLVSHLNSVSVSWVCLDEPPNDNQTGWQPPED